MCASRRRITSRSRSPRVLTTPCRRRPRNRNGCGRRASAICERRLCAGGAGGRRGRRLRRRRSCRGGLPGRRRYGSAGTAPLPAGVGSLPEAPGARCRRGTVASRRQTGVSGALAGSSPRTIACSRNSAASLAA
jgi:hypothetical protein